MRRRDCFCYFRRMKDDLGQFELRLDPQRESGASAPPSTGVSRTAREPLANEKAKRSPKKPMPQQATPSESRKPGAIEQAERRDKRIEQGFARVETWVTTEVKLCAQLQATAEKVTVQQLLTRIIAAEFPAAAKKGTP
jgi:hypothetical protein